MLSANPYVSSCLLSAGSNIGSYPSCLGEIIETVHQLQGLSIISGDDKEKQRKQAKNIDLRKRKSLATLLHTLHKIGT